MRLHPVRDCGKAKISLRAYQNYESGRRCPNVSVARLISQELNVPMDELF